MPIPDVSDAKYKRGSRFDSLHHSQFAFGIRTCPDVRCRGLVAVLLKLEYSVPTISDIFPAALLNFETDNIPEALAGSMREAIACHSVKAFRSSALMVRRTLELLCETKEVEGTNLMERLANLKRHAVLSPSLLEAADHLRLLGNDAAHVEAKVYDEIDHEHSETAIEVAKEILKAVYQHGNLVARLNKLKKSNDPA